MKIRSTVLAIAAGLAVSTLAAPALAITGSLSTPSASGLTSGGNWVTNGFKVAWNVNPNGDGTWHYQYTLSRASGASLTPGASHAVFQLSSNIEESDIFNFSGNYGDSEFGTFGVHPSNPGFPVGKSIFGMKIDFAGSGTTVIGFDSTRQPMWGDFYAKGGSTSFTYNTSLGVAVANANDYLDTPLDIHGNPLSKILVPDTIEGSIPSPGSLALVALGGLVATRRRRN